MPADYQHDKQYERYKTLNLAPEFVEAKRYLWHNPDHRNVDVFAAVDEIYHWFQIKQIEVAELCERLRSMEGKSQL